MTNRNYIIAMCDVMSFVMMIFLCLFPTVGTLKICRSIQFPANNCPVNCLLVGFNMRMFQRISFGTFSGYLHTSFRTPIFKLLFFVFSRLFVFSLICLIWFFLVIYPKIILVSFILLIELSAQFTINLMPIFFGAAFTKFRNWLYLFALRTSFGYDCVRHNLFLNKRLCLGPFILPVRMRGSFYYTRREGYFNS